MQSRKGGNSPVLGERNPVAAHARLTLRFPVRGVSFCELFLLGEGIFITKARKGESTEREGKGMGRSP